FNTHEKAPRRNVGTDFQLSIKLSSRMSVVLQNTNLSFWKISRMPVWGLVTVPFLGSMDVPVNGSCQYQTRFTTGKPVMLSSGLPEALVCPESLSYDRVKFSPGNTSLDSSNDG